MKTKVSGLGERIRRAQWRRHHYQECLDQPHTTTMRTNADFYRDKLEEEDANIARLRAELAELTQYPPSQP